LIEAWNVGVEERAYYATGTYMAQKIEENCGTKYLAELVNKGSMQFVRDYNAVVLNDYKIVLSNTKSLNSVIQNIKFLRKVS